MNPPGLASGAVLGRFPFLTHQQGTKRTRNQERANVLYVVIVAVLEGEGSMNRQGTPGGGNLFNLKGTCP